MGNFMDNQSPVHPQANKDPPLWESESLEGLLFGGGAALLGEGGQGVGGSAVDHSLDLGGRFNLQQFLQPRQVRFQTPDHRSNPGFRLVVVKQGERANLDLIPVEPGVSVLHDGGFGAQHVALGVRDLVVILYLGSRRQVGRDFPREVQAGGDPLGGDKIRVGVGPYPAANGAVEEPHLHDVGVSLGSHGEVYVAREIHLFTGLHNLDAAAGCGQAGNRRQGDDKDPSQGNQHGPPDCYPGRYQ